MNLRKRALGLSGVSLTETGFGAWALGGGGWAFSWGPQDDNASIATMRHAVELGIDWIDTAAVYGLGHSEEIVGRFLREQPHPRGRSFSLSAACSGMSATRKQSRDGYSSRNRFA